MRLAWFSPWPPQPSGVAGRSAELVPLLTSRGYGIDVFVDERVVAVAKHTPATAPAPGEVRIQSAHDFVWRVGRNQYDLVVYQMGNSRLHQYIWPYLVRWPGLAILHDVRLHHARGRALISAKRHDAYRAEFAWSHPDARPDGAEAAIAGFGGSYYYMWPMVRVVLERSRVVAAHTRGGAAELQDAFPNHRIEYVALGSGRATLPTPDERAAWRRERGWEPDSVVFGVFGGLTAEKRVAQVLRAFRATLAREPRARLVLAGASDGFSDWPSVARWFQVEHQVTFAGTLDDAAFEQTVAAVDVSINLRWPTAVETSGPWLQALAAGRPTIVTDLAHQTHVPTVDPRNWLPYDAKRGAPVAVGIDLLDEDHSLMLAMRRLAIDGDLRDKLGRTARGYWEREHSIERMVTEYDALLRRSIERPPDAPSELPMPLAERPGRHVSTLVAPFGDLSCGLF
jgi:glycosyltransferase involved in cell wall biosynthesis